jgi:16S rRNA (cytosine1402-N4)-methyltransferase
VTPGGAGEPPVEGHVPVLLERTVALLAPALTGPADGGAVLVDATLGLGGHSEALLRRFGTLRVIGLDRDPDALRRSRERLAAYSERIAFVPAIYDELPELLTRLGLRRVQGVLFDLGVSSLQLDDAARGFSYSRDAPLDMRMDPTQGQTAAEVLDTYPVTELTRVLRDYGEERFARRVAERIVRERQRAPFTPPSTDTSRTGGSGDTGDTGDTSGVSGTRRLAELVREAIPAATRRTGGHPAKRTFQALRIEVNEELRALERALPAAVAALAVGGRVVVLSYQSLEDRMVKRVLAAGAASAAPPGLPVVPERLQPRLRLLTRGAETPTPEEITSNPRAASVRLRAAERIREAAA